MLKFSNGRNYLQEPQIKRRSTPEAQNKIADLRYNFKLTLFYPNPP